MLHGSPFTSGVGEQQHGRQLLAEFLFSSADWTRQYWRFCSIDDFYSPRRTCIYQGVRNLSFIDDPRGSGDGLWWENRQRTAGKRDWRLQLPEDEVTNLGDDYPHFRFTY